LSDTGLVLPAALLVDGWDGFNPAAILCFPLAGIGGFPAPFPIVMSGFLGCSIFQLPFAFKELYSPAFGYLLRLASIEILIQPI